MKMIIYLLTILVLSTSNLFAQDNTCNCAENLNKLIVKTEENYAGFPSKVNEKTLKGYNKLIKNLQKNALGITNPKSCFYLLKEYIVFFKDKHFFLDYSDPKDYDNKTIVLSEATFKNELSKRKVSELEGIWINADTTIKLAIKKYPRNVYKAIVIQSENPKISTGLVYFTITKSKRGLIAKEYNSFNTTETRVKQKGNLLQIWSNEMFGKTYPNELTLTEKQELNTWRNNNRGLDFRQLSSKTAYLKVPTFFNNDDAIEKLIRQYDSIIKTSDNLIVDLTGNGGGNSGWISFLPYFMTNTIIQYPHSLRITPDNVKAKLSDIESTVVDPIPDEYKKYFTDEVVLKYKKAYQELPVTKEKFYPIPGPVLPLDSILVKPKNIALVVDDLSGSSSEFFFFLSKQSKKTTTYGINTVGMMDYEGMSNSTVLPYSKYFLAIPIAKSSWTDTHPIDINGFRPDKLLHKIKQEDWVEYIKTDLEKQ